jgi:hypothetical protein
MFLIRRLATQVCGLKTAVLNRESFELTSGKNGKSLESAVKNSGLATFRQKTTSGGSPASPELPCSAPVYCS